MLFSSLTCITLILKFAQKFLILYFDDNIKNLFSEQFILFYVLNFIMLGLSYFYLLSIWKFDWISLKIRLTRILIDTLIQNFWEIKGLFVWTIFLLISQFRTQKKFGMNICSHPLRSESQLQLNFMLRFVFDDFFAGRWNGVL